MSRFVLTAEIQMRGPTSSELNTIASQIRSGLSGVNVPINIQIPPNQQRVLNNVAADLKKVRRAAVETTDSFELLGKSLSQNIRRYGAFTAATGAFIRLGIAIRQSIGEAIDFETEIRKIAQGQDRAISSYAALRGEIDILSKSLGVSSLSLASTSRILAQAGLSAYEVKAALSALAKSTLAPTFGEMNETTEASIAIMRQFKIEATGLESVLGSINQVAADFAVESEDIAAAIKLAGASFAAASPQFQEGEESLRQFVSLFTSIRQTTRGSAESIATGLRTITTRLQRGGTIEYFKSLGIELRDNEGQFIGAYEAIRKVSAALKDIPGTDSRFANIAELLGGYRQIDKTIPLLQQFAVAERAYQSSLKGRDSLDKGLALAQETLAVKFARVREEFNSLVRKISENEGFRAMITLSLKLASSFIKVVDSITPLLPLIAALGLVKLGIALPKIGRGFAADYRGAVGRKADGGKVHYFNKGGIVPGHGNSDTVPAMLTPGERVVPKKDVKKYADGSPGGVNNQEENLTPQQIALKKHLDANGGYKKFVESNPGFLQLTKAKQIEAASKTKYKTFAKSIDNFYANSKQIQEAQSIRSDTSIPVEEKTAAIKRVKRNPFTHKIAVINDGVVGAMFATTSKSKDSTVPITAEGENFQFSSPAKKQAKKNRETKDTKAYEQYQLFKDKSDTVVDQVIFPAKYYYANSSFDPSFAEKAREGFAVSIDNMVDGLINSVGKSPFKPKRVSGNNALREKIIAKIGINDVLGKVFEGAVSSQITISDSPKQDENFDFTGDQLLGNQFIKNIFGENLSKNPPVFLDAKYNANAGAIDTLKKKVTNQIGGHSQYYKLRTVTQKDIYEPRKEGDKGLSNKEIDDYFHVGKKGILGLKGERAFKGAKAGDTPYFPKAFANGGLVPGSGNTDSVPMNLENGQYVIRKKAVEHIGAGNLAKLANGGPANSLVMPGEYIFDTSSAKRIGTSTLGKLNHADKFANGGLKRYANGTSTQGPGRFARFFGADETEPQKAYRQRQKPKEDSYKVVGEDKAGNRIVSVIKAKTEKDIEAMFLAIGGKLTASIKLTKTQVALHATGLSPIKGSSTTRDLTKEERLVAKNASGTETHKQRAVKDVKYSKANVRVEADLDDILSEAGVLTSEGIARNKANRDALNKQQQKDTTKISSSSSGRKAIAAKINSGSASDSEKRGYEDAQRIKFAQKVSVTGLDGKKTLRHTATDDSLEKIIIRNRNATKESDVLTRDAAIKELQQRRGIKPGAVGGTGGVGGGQGGNDTGGNSPGVNGQGGESPLAKAAVLGFALQSITTLATSVGLLGEHSNKAVDGVTHLGLLLGTAFSGLSQIKSILPQGGQDYLSGIQDKRKQQFLGTGARKTATGAAVLATAAAAAGGAYLSSVGNEELSQGKASGAVKSAQGSALTGAATGAALGVAFGPLGVAIGAAAGAAIGFTEGMMKASKAIENFNPERLSKSLNKINTGNYKTQDLANLKNTAFVQDTSYLALFGKGGGERAATKEELSEKGVTQDTIINAFSNATSLKELDTKEIRAIAKAFNVNVDTLKSDFAERVRNNKAIKDSQDILDKNSIAAVKYSNALNRINNNFDKAEAIQGLAAQSTDEVRSGNVKGRDFSAFANLAKKGESTPEIESIIQNAENGPHKDVATGARFEIESAKLTKEILTKQAEKGPLQRDGINNLGQQLRDGLKAKFGDGEASKVETEVARITNVLSKEFSGNEEEVKKGLVNAEDVQKLQDKVASADKPALETLLRFNHAVANTSASIANLGKEALNVKLDTISKLGANLEQFDATRSNVSELRGETFDKVAATQTNRSIQLGEIGFASKLPIGPSGNSIQDVSRIAAIRADANTNLSALRDKKDLGTFDSSDIGAEKQFNEQLVASTKALKLFGEGSEQVIAALESKASELKQRREAGLNSALGYLTSDRKGKQQQRKDLDFALRLSQGQVSAKDFAGNAGGVQAAKSLFGEKEANQFFSKIPGLEGLAKANPEEDKLHQQIMLENTARKKANDLLTDQSTLLTAINKEMEAFHKSLVLLNTNEFKDRDNGPGQEVVQHKGQFTHDINLSIKGLNENLVDRAQVQEMLKVSINRWWNAQQGGQGHVQMGDEHVQQ